MHRDRYGGGDRQTDRQTDRQRQLRGAHYVL